MTKASSGTSNFHGIISNRYFNESRGLLMRILERFFHSLHSQSLTQKEERKEGARYALVALVILYLKR